MAGADLLENVDIFQFHFSPVQLARQSKGVVCSSGDISAEKWHFNTATVGDLNMQ